MKDLVKSVLKVFDGKQADTGIDQYQKHHSDKLALLLSIKNF